MVVVVDNVIVLPLCLSVACTNLKDVIHITMIFMLSQCEFSSYVIVDDIKYLTYFYILSLNQVSTCSELGKWFN